MDESPDPSPFAAFAMPKRSAIEEFQQRQRKASQVRRKMFGCVLSCVVGAAGGSATCAAFDRDVEIVLTALVGSVAGGLLGVLLGLVVGSICFAVTMLAGSRGNINLELQFARRDPMTMMRGLLFVWSLIGTAIGAAIGALLGVKWADAAVELQPLGRPAMFASIAGGAFAVGVWFLAQRSQARAETAPPETA